MKLRYPAPLRRVWPLAFSALALWGLVRITPALYADYEFSRDGVATYGWYTDLDQQNESIHYAYSARNVTYGGRESWEDEKSDVYYRHNGDKLAVSYLAGQPWISRKDWAMQERWRTSEMWAAIYLAVFVAGISFSVFHRGKTARGSPSFAASPEAGSHG